MDKNLYKATNGLGTFYVVAESYDDAEKKVLERLDKADYGFFSYRKVTSIVLMATEHFFNGKQSFSDDNGNLIV